MKVIAFGDIHMDCTALDAVKSLDEAGLVIITGDLTHFGGKKEAKEVIDAVKAKNANILAVPGNLDQPSVGAYLDELGISLHAKGIIIDDTGFFGVGGSNITPFNTPIEYTEEEMASLVTEAFKHVKGTRHKIFVSHAPPLDTKTDMLGNGIHVGSKAIREFITTHQPDLCLTGHIHESWGVDFIGRTKILNPGMLRRPGWIKLNFTANGWEAELNGLT